MSRPATVTRPEVAAVNPAIIRMVVVLPAPFGPRNPTISPFPTVKDRSWMIVLAPYRFETDSRATTAGAALMTGGETARGGPRRPPPGDTARRPPTYTSGRPFRRTGPGRGP